MQLLEAFSIFDSQTLPSDKEELSIYGQNRLEALVVMYGEGPNPDVDSEECKSEARSQEADSQQIVYSSTTM